MIKVLIASLSDIDRTATFKSVNDQLRTIFFVPSSIEPNRKVFASAIGRLMCQQLLLEQQISEDLWQTMHRNPFGKLMLESSRLDFNVSHSGDFIAAVLTNQGLAGIDIEELQPIAWRSYEDCFSHSEWAMILNSFDPEKVFFELWTKKESLSKAYGFGLQFPLNTLEVCNNIGKILNTEMKGFFYPLDIPGYSAFVCVNEEQEMSVQNFKILQ